MPSTTYANINHAEKCNCCKKKKKVTVIVLIMSSTSSAKFMLQIAIIMSKWIDSLDWLLFALHHHPYSTPMQMCPLVYGMISA